MATPNELVNEVLQGKWGNAETRKQKLKAAGYSYIEIQSLINIKYGARPVAATTQELVQEVLEGRWGNGADRKRRLTAAGQNYAMVQRAVNLAIGAGATISSVSPKAQTTTSSVPAAKIGSTITARGIDISAWQGNVDFAKVKASGIDFAIFREGYGTSVDNKFFEYVSGAKQTGLPIHGVYHFCYSVNENQVLAEAKACIANVKKAGLDKNTIIFFDFEYDTVTRAKNKGVILGKAQCIAFTKVFCNYVNQQGYKAGVYSNLDYYNTMYDAATINSYIYWVAHYNGGGSPKIPGAYHQWTDKGGVSGISGNVDLDNCYIIAATTTSSKNAELKTAETTKSSEAAASINNNFNSYYGKVSNCGKDERGAYSGGQAGDQSGKEWYITNWYNSGWRCVLRHPNAKVRELLADLAIQAALNNNVGYDQVENRTYWNQLRAVGYYPKNITVPCEADCSSGVIANTKAVGFLLDMDALKNINATYTRNMREGYRAAGFQVLTDAKYLNSFDYLLPGDILLNDDQHTNTNLGYGKYAENTNSNTASQPVFNKETKFVGTVNADLLNFRTWAGASYPQVAKYPQLTRGTKVNVCDTTQAANGVDWYYINYNGVYGFVCAAYITK